MIQLDWYLSYGLKPPTRNTLDVKCKWVAVLTVGDLNDNMPFL